jgi:hypothetical protein
MMDNVEKVISEIEHDSGIMRVRFTGLLDDTANVLERYGLGSAKAFLLEKQGHDNLRQQATALISVLEKLEKYPDVSRDRKTMRLIIKAISSMQRQGRR